MTVTAVAVEAVRIDGAVSQGLNGTLDPIHVYWVNLEPGAGYVTITCYGDSWTQYFGAMSGQTIQQFFARADVEYLVNALGIKASLKQGTRNTLYLTRIVQAVKDALNLPLSV